MGWCLVFNFGSRMEPTPEKPSFSHLCPNDLGPISGIKHDKIGGKLGRAKVGGITQKRNVWLPVSPRETVQPLGRPQFGPQNPTVLDGTHHSKWLVIGWFFLHKHGNNYSNNYRNRFWRFPILWNMNILFWYSNFHPRPTELSSFVARVEACVLTETSSWWESIVYLQIRNQQGRWDCHDPPKSMRCVCKRFKSCCVQNNPWWKQSISYQPGLQTLENLREVEISPNRGVVSHLVTRWNLLACNLFK